MSFVNSTILQGVQGMSQILDRRERDRETEDGLDGMVGDPASVARLRALGPRR
jgi:hypothetical protein